jgi:CubicO group peptidase (beta-lactamase class C family)
MTTSLPRSAADDQQVDPAAILGFLDAVEDHPGIEMHSLMVVRHGQVVAEGWWAPYSARRPHLLYSLSKSFTSTAAAFAQAEGLLDLDDTVVSHFGEFAATISDPRSRSVKIRHIASMASGHTRDMISEALAGDPAEPVRGFLLNPPDREPGTVFAYNQPCTYTLGSIIQRNAGMLLTQYLRPRLFDPLGIGRVGWHTWPPGREQGFSGLHARTEDIAKLGLLYLQRGRWDGKQLIPEAWVAEATSRHIATPAQWGADWQQGYGFQFWMSRHGYRGDGAFGQFCVVLPEQDTVVVTTACTLDMQALLDAMWAHLLPGLGRVTADGGSAQHELAARLGRLALPACQAGPAPADPAPWSGQTFTVAAGTGGSQRQPPLTSVTVAPGADGWQLSLGEPANSITFPVGAGAWVVSEPADRHGDTIPVAASAGWPDGSTLRAEIIFLETPHRMDLTCSLAGRRAEAAWRQPPLSAGRLQELHCPGLCLRARAYDAVHDRHFGQANAGQLSSPARVDLRTGDRHAARIQPPGHSAASPRPGMSAGWRASGQCTGCDPNELKKDGPGDPMPVVVSYPAPQVWCAGVVAHRPMVDSSGGASRAGPATAPSV